MTLVARVQVSDGRDGAIETLRHMRGLALAGSKSMAIRGQALALTAGLRQKDLVGEACTLLAFCRDNVRYVRDIATVEVLQTAETTLRIAAGDCDDKAILLAALLGSIGHRARFIAVAFFPDRYSHVWVQANIRGRWVDLEPTEPIGCGRSVPTAGAADLLTLDC